MSCSCNSNPCNASCDCEALQCEIDALKTNQTELFQRTQDLADAINAMTPYVIAFIADCGTAGAEQTQFAELISAWTPDAVVLGGDINYPDGDDADADANLLAFNEFIAAEKLFPVMGNHDFDSDGPLNINNFFYRKFPYLFNTDDAYGDSDFLLPHYRKKVENRSLDMFFLFSGLKSNGTFEDGSITEEVSKNWYEVKASQSEMKHKLVFMHSGGHGPEIDGVTFRYDDLLNLAFTGVGVSGVFTGHTHTAWHLSLIDASSGQLHLVDCSATTESPRAFANPYAILGPTPAAFQTNWKYDEATRYAVKILVYPTYYRVEFWTIDGDIHHGFNVAAPVS